MTVKYSLAYVSRQTSEMNINTGDTQVDDNQQCSVRYYLHVRSLQRPFDHVSLGLLSAIPIIDIIQQPTHPYLFGFGANAATVSSILHLRIPLLAGGSSPYNDVIYRFRPVCNASRYHRIITSRGQQLFYILVHEINWWVQRSALASSSSLIRP